MNSVGAYEAKTHFSQLLDRVQQGERITILRHGVPVAVLQPVDPTARRLTRREAIEALKVFGVGRELGDLSIKEMIEEGRD